MKKKNRKKRKRCDTDTPGPWMVLVVQGLCMASFGSPVREIKGVWNLPVRHQPVSRGAYEKGVMRQQASLPAIESLGCHLCVMLQPHLPKKKKNPVSLICSMVSEDCVLLSVVYFKCYLLVRHKALSGLFASHFFWKKGMSKREHHLPSVLQIHGPRLTTGFKGESVGDCMFYRRK